MPWKPSVPGERPTLGFYALDWISENLAAPDREDYEPLVLTREQAEFALAFYELDPITGRRIIRRGVLSRSRGWGKSPIVSAFAILEGLGEVVFDGWDANGQPVGKPWSRIRTPLVQIAAASEDQTSNAWDPLLEMLAGDAPVFDNYPGLEPLGGFVNLPWGRIEPVTTSSTSLKGKRPVFMLADQTEQWTPGNRATEVYDVIVNNIYKVGGSIIETPNAYTPGMDSQAERTATAARDIIEGRNKKITTGMLYDHREAPADTDMADDGSLTRGLRYAYGDSAKHPDGCVLHDPPCTTGWVDIEGIKERIWQTDATEQQSRSDWLNQITHASDSWLSQPEVQAIVDVSRVVADKETIVLGFDGSRGRAKGKPDATALIACTVADPHMWEVGVWEASDERNSWDGWEPNLVEIEAAIRQAFNDYRVVGFYCDPARDWRSHVNKWEADYGAQLVVKSTRDHPCEWWMNTGRSVKVQNAIESLEGAIANRDLTLSGEYRLVSHLMNARRRLVKGHLRLGKENDYSGKKIDAAVAAVLAWQARLDAVAAGATKKKPTSTKFGRIY